jgi:pantothenate kinase
MDQYNYCIVLLQDNYDYQLPAAFISTFTATTFISTSTATCIHSVLSALRLEAPGNRKKFGTSSVGSGTAGELLALLTNV